MLILSNKGRFGDYTNLRSITWTWSNLSLVCNNNVTSWPVLSYSGNRHCCSIRPHLLAAAAVDNSRFCLLLLLHGLTAVFQSSMDQPYLALIPWASLSRVKADRLRNPLKVKVREIQLLCKVNIAVENLPTPAAWDDRVELKMKYNVN